uniref:C2H2-type domain-containing protein n=1 Tax=Plectus sambesii TaxID=2011161 RepID=A0A914VJ57_9BILA
MSEQKKRKLDRLIERMRHNNNNNNINAVVAAAVVAVEEKALTAGNLAKIGGCRLCDVRFASESDLLLHIIEHYPERFYLSCDDDASKEKENEEKRLIDKEIKRVAAEVKGFKSSRSAVIVDRERCLSQDSPTMVERMRNGASSSTSDSPSDLPYFMCPECCLTFSDSDAYNAHLDQHMLWRVTQRLTDFNHAKIQRCIQCDAHFTDAHRYQEHMRSHSNTQESVCIVCGQTFGTQFELNLHMGSHTGGTYDCKECGKCFENRKALTQHHKAHNHFACPDCSATLGSRAELTNHLLSSHESKISSTVDDNSTTRDNQTPLSAISSSVTPLAIQAPRTPSSHGDASLSPPAVSGSCARVAFDKGAMNNAYLDGLLEDICAKQDKKRKSTATTEGIAAGGRAAADQLGAAVSPHQLAKQLPAFSSFGNGQTTDADAALQNDYLNSVLETNVRRYNRERPKSFAQREEESLNAASEAKSKEAMFALFQLAMRAASTAVASTKL